MENIINEEKTTSKAPIKVFEVEWICRAHQINHRFDVTKCGQDCSDTRLNLFTDKKGNVVKMYIG